MQVEIEYCVACGFLDRAIEVARLLLNQFGTRLAGVRLRTGGGGGVFRVTVDSEAIFDRHHDG